MWREESLSMERGRWKFSGMRDSIASAISVITEILPESVRYAEKYLWVWYAIHAPRAGTKCFCIPAVRYFSLGSEKKALIR